MRGFGHDDVVPEKGPAGLTRGGKVLLITVYNSDIAMS
jgi:hypothetical protein